MWWMRTYWSYCIQRLHYSTTHIAAGKSIRECLSSSVVCGTVCMLTPPLIIWFHTCATCGNWLMLLPYPKDIFFPKFNTQMSCMINSRRTVKTEQPFTGRDLTRHYWSVRKTKEYLPSTFSWGSLETDVRISPRSSQKHPQSCVFVRRAYACWRLLP